MTLFGMLRGLRPRRCLTIELAVNGQVLFTTERYHESTVTWLPDQLLLVDQPEPGQLLLATTDRGLPDHLARPERFDAARQFRNILHQAHVDWLEGRVE